MRQQEFGVTCWCESHIVPATPEDVKRGFTEPCDAIACVVQALEASNNNTYGASILQRQSVKSRMNKHKYHPKVKGRF